MNAIILAAGVGHRMMNLTRQLNKVLLPIGGVAMIERTICYLKEAGIDEIVIVTGHKHELFLPLQVKYGVTLIRNKRYATHNNLYSLKLALGYLDQTYLIFGDVILFKNIFLQQPNATTIYTTYKNTRGVPMLEVCADRYHTLTSFGICKEDKKIVTSLGISYIARAEADLIQEHFHKHVNEKKLRDYKGELEIELLPLTKGRNIHVHPVDTKYGNDINLITEYYDACLKYEELQKQLKEAFVK